MHFGKQAYLGGGSMTGQGFVEEGAPGAGEEGALRDVFHEGHICVADTQELTVKGWMRRGGTKS